MLSRRLIVLSLLCLLAVATPTDTALSRPARPGVAPTLHTIPPRPVDAISGSRFLARLAGINGARREQLVLAELRRGNVPDRLRELRPVTLRAESATNQAAATVWVMPDYLSIGSNADSVRVPVDFYTAATIAREWNMSLPTKRIVDAVWRQATVKLSPAPMTPGPQMTSSSYFMRHEELIRRALDGASPTGIVAGHKKDLVLTSLLLRTPPRVAIYGWHRKSGQPIQPLSVVHGATYVDYSHGVRLVSRTVEINGRQADLVEVIADPKQARLLTAEGRIAEARRILATARPGTATPAR